MDSHIECLDRLVISLPVPFQKPFVDIEFIVIRIKDDGMIICHCGAGKISRKT